MSVAPVTVTEVRVLEGPNLYFSRPAIKIIVSCPGYLGVDEATLRAASARLGMRVVRPRGLRTRNSASEPSCALWRRLSAGLPQPRAGPGWEFVCAPEGCALRWSLPSHGAGGVEAWHWASPSDRC